MGDRFNAVPAWRHPHIHKGKCVGVACDQGLPHLSQSILSIMCRVEVKIYGLDPGCGFLKQNCFGRVQTCRRFVRCLENFPEILVDHLIIINHQHTAILWERRINHDIVFGGCRGNVRMNVAPMPVPSLCTVNAPPISLAASAPLCRPNPCPSFLVVKPWAKMRVRFSVGIPMPLSATDTLTRPSLLNTCNVSCLSVRSDSSQACFALRTKFTRICSTLCFSTLIGGTASNSRVTSTPCRFKAPSSIRKLSSTRSRRFTISFTPETLAKLCCIATTPLMCSTFLWSKSNSLTITSWSARR